MDSRNVIFKIVSKERINVVRSGTCDSEGNYSQFNKRVPQCAMVDVGSKECVMRHA